MKEINFVKEESEGVTFHLGRENKYPYYALHQNPNCSYRLLEPTNIFQPYRELLTDGQVTCFHQMIYVENAKFVILREKVLGRYQMANLVTEEEDKMSLAYYDYLASKSFHTMEKQKKYVYCYKDNYEK